MNRGDVILVRFPHPSERQLKKSPSRQQPGGVSAFFPISILRMASWAYHNDFLSVERGLGAPLRHVVAGSARTGIVVVASGTVLVIKRTMRFMFTTRAVSTAWVRTFSWP